MMLDFKSLKTKDIATLIEDSVKRFPFAYFYVIAAISVAIFSIEKGDSYENLSKIVYTIIGNFPLSIMLKLFSERYENKVKVFVIQIVPQIFWGIFSWSYITNEVTRTIPFLLLSAPVMIWVLYLTFIFLDRKTDLCFWKFNGLNLGNFLNVSIISVIFYVGLALLYLALDKLFDIEISSKAWQYLSVFCWLFVEPVLFLSFYPKSDEIFNEEAVKIEKKSNIIIHVLLLGFLGLYIIVLYVYFIFTLPKEGLPRGFVSVLVSLSMGLMLMMFFLLYPNLYDENNKFDKKLFRILPIVMIPLLVLMSIGINRRFNDYGITIPRLWLVIVNIWFYGVCIYFIVVKRCKISWVLISFALSFLVFSVGPWSVKNITLKVLKNDINDLCQQNNIALPIENADEIDAMNNRDEIIPIVSKIRYLQNNYNKEEYAEITKDAITLFPIDTVEFSNNYYFSPEYPISLPSKNKGYVCNIEEYGYNTIEELDNNQVVISLSHNDTTFEFEVQKDFLTQNNNDRSIILENNDYYFVVINYNLKSEKDDKLDKNITISGLILKK